jgi:hypothetical protein
MSVTRPPAADALALLVRAGRRGMATAPPRAYNARSPRCPSPRLLGVAMGAATPIVPLADRDADKSWARARSREALVAHLDRSREGCGQERARAGERYGARWP